MRNQRRSRENRERKLLQEKLEQEVAKLERVRFAF